MKRTIIEILIILGFVWLLLWGLFGCAGNKIIYTKDGIIYSDCDKVKNKEDKRICENLKYYKSLEVK